MTVRSRIVAVQNQFDILHGEYGPHEGVQEYASGMGISYIAWSPLARGLLTEKYLDVTKTGPGDRLFDEGTIGKNSIVYNMEKLHKLAALSHLWDMKLNQLALSYMLTLPGMGPVIPSSSSVQQLESNAAAGKITLSEDQKMQIRTALQ